MSGSGRRYNFSSGPSTLPEPVLRRAQAALWDLDGSGIGVLEHSHRGPELLRVLDDAETRARRLAGVPDTHAVTFVTGTASQHFHMVPMNFLPPGGVADYVHTGAWSGKALEEARRFGGSAAVHLAGDAEPGGFREVPQTLTWSADAAYAHYTSNETIHGTQWVAPPVPPAGVPLVCDGSSDLFSRPIDVAAHDLVYAGAQKNLGPAGLALVIVRRSFAESHGAALAPLLRYHTYVRDRALYNTPATFGIYVIGEVLAWIEAEGGLTAMATRAEMRAARLYEFLDDSPVFTAHAAVGSRSRMNVTFRATTTAIDEAALAACEEAGLSGLRGHRSAGGLRASLYNAMPMAGVEKLVQVLAAVDRQHR